MLLRLAVVVYSHEKDVAGVFGYFCGIFLALYLVDGCVDGVVELQLYVCLQATKQFTRVARLVVVGTQHSCRHRLAESAAAGDAAIAVFGVERGVDKWNERRLVNILVGDYVPKLTVASVYICSHNIIEPVAGEISLRFGAKLQQIRYLSKLFLKKCKSLREIKSLNK